MFEDMPEKYIDVLSLQTTQRIVTWQKVNASMDSSEQQIEKQRQYQTWTQAIVLVARHAMLARPKCTLRMAVYRTSSITKKAPWISPFFSSK